METVAGAAVRGRLLGLWSRRGELLGSFEVGEEESGGVEFMRAGWRRGAEEVSLVAVPFPGGYRVRLREAWRGAEKTLWIAPLEEGEEGYIGLFSEQELRKVFPRLAGEVRSSGMGGLLHRALRGDGRAGGG